MGLAIREMIDSEGSLMLTKTGVQATMILVALGLSTGCGPSPVVPPHDTANTTTAAQDFGEVVAAVDKQLLESQIREACTYCHAYPEPQTIPKEFWEKELRQAYGFLEHSDFDPQKVPPFAPTLRFFRDRAPDRFEIEPPQGTPSPLVFQTRDLAVEVDRETTGQFALPVYQGVSNIQWSPWGAEKQNASLITDMPTGQIFVWEPRTGRNTLSFLGKVTHPGHLETTDLDQDGRPDALVADLGTLQTSDAKKGQVLWLHADESGTYQMTSLLAGVGRVADVRAADFDSDGDRDLVVAEFGGQFSGHVLYLENRTTDYREPHFEVHTLDDRAGVIHVPVADLNGDGRLDFMALISQEHEKIVAFLNQGDGKFRKEVVFDANNAGYGSAGIELTDVDGDGDLDVLLVNGDTLDFQIYRPYHQVQWLENKGSFPFQRHALTPLPGGLAVSSGDLDADGDLDIVASAFLPFGITDPQTGVNLLDGKRVASLVWLEQTSPRQFETHVLETGRYSHATVKCADVDGDGDLDLLTGHFTLEGITPRAIGLSPLPGMITIWENQLR